MSTGSRAPPRGRHHAGGRSPPELPLTRRASDRATAPLTSGGHPNELGRPAARAPFDRLGYLSPVGGGPKASHVGSPNHTQTGRFGYCWWLLRPGTVPIERGGAKCDTGTESRASRGLAEILGRRLDLEFRVEGGYREGHAIGATPRRFSPEGRSRPNNGTPRAHLSAVGGAAGVVHGRWRGGKSDTLTFHGAERQADRVFSDRETRVSRPQHDARYGHTARRVQTARPGTWRGGAPGAKTAVYSSPWTP